MGRGAQVTVFGASGKIGNKVVARLLKRDYKVKAFVYRNTDFLSHPNLSIVQGDIHNTDDIAPVLTGSEAIISTLGSWNTPSKDILTAGMRNIIPAAESAGIKRIISLTGADARASGDEKGFVHRLSYFGLSKIAPKILADGEKHIELLNKSKLNWTVLRSPLMNNIGSDAYRLQGQRPAPGRTVRRDAVAKAMVDQLDSTDYLKKSPFIIRG